MAGSKGYPGADGKKCRVRPVAVREVRPRGQRGASRRESSRKDAYPQKPTPLKTHNYLLIRRFDQMQIYVPQTCSGTGKVTVLGARYSVVDE